MGKVKVGLHLVYSCSGYGVCVGMGSSEELGLGLFTTCVQSEVGRLGLVVGYARRWYRVCQRGGIPVTHTLRMGRGS